MKKTILTGVVAAAFLANILNPLATSAHGVHLTTKDFKDIPDSFWGATTINWGLENHISNGYPDKTFKPNGKITEAEFLTMALKYFPETNASNFLTAAHGKHWSTPYYEYAAAKHLPVTNKADQAIRRGGAAHLVATLMGYNSNEEAAVQYLMTNGLAKGRGNDGFAPDANLTRTEAIQFLKNIDDKRGAVAGVDGEETKVEGDTPKVGDKITLPDGSTVVISAAGQKPSTDTTKGSANGNVNAWNNYVNTLIGGLSQKQKDAINAGEQAYAKMFKADAKMAGKWGEHVYAAIVKTTVSGSKAKVYIPQGLPSGYTVQIAYADIKDRTIKNVIGTPEYVDIDLKDKDFTLTVAIRDSKNAGVIIATYDSLAKGIHVGGKAVDRNVVK